MARRQTYGERMAEFERQQDESNWRRSLYSAIEQKDDSRIRELVKEGIGEGYDFLDVSELTAYLSEVSH